MNDCEELAELKKYFEDFEKEVEDIDQDDEF